MSNPTAQQVIDKAASYIGIGGTDNIFNTWYYGYHVYDPNRYPWCAAFQSYVFKMAGYDCNASASAAGFANQFSRIPVEQEGGVRPGDVVIFNWDGRGDTSWSDHVGLVEWSTIDRDGRFGTIEGNTGSGEGSVMRVTRTNWGNYFTAFFRPAYGTGEAVKPVEPERQTKTKKAARLYGIDVSSNQSANVVAKAKNGFAVVKLTGNPQGYRWNFVNPYAEQQINDALKKHGNVAVYHFTWGKDAVTEANFFVKQFNKLGLKGKAWPVIDYEAQALNLGRNWLKKLAQTIYKKLGVKPLIYASGSVIVSQNLFALGYPIWCANYSKSYEEVDGRSTAGMKIYPGCENAIMWQFTSQGRVPGYGGLLDCDVFFGSSARFKRFIAGTNTSNKPSKDKTVTKTTTAKQSVDIDALARDVIAGKYGNGEQRRNALGSNYDAVQQRVNEMLS